MASDTSSRSTGIKNYLTFTSDKNFLPFVRVLLKSLQRNSPIFTIVARLVNCDESDIVDVKSLYHDIEIIDDQRTLSTKKNLLTKDGEFYQDFLQEGFSKNHTSVNRARWLYSEQIAYCSNIKIDTMDKLLSRDDCKTVIYTDADTIVRGSLEGLLKLTMENDFSFFEDEPYQNQHAGSKRLSGQDVLFQGGLIGVSKNEKTVKFVSDWKEEIMADIFDWDVDEKTFYKIHNSSIKIGKIPETFKDENLSDDSCLWSGAGSTKFSNEKYNIELKKYEHC